MGLVLNGRVRLPLIAAQCGTRPGVAALVRGVALNGWFLKTMRDGDGPIRTDKPVPKLTTTGPLRYTRNPGYLALTPILEDIRGVATEPRREAARRG